MRVARGILKTNLAFNDENQGKKTIGNIKNDEISKWIKISISKKMIFKLKTKEEIRLNYKLTFAKK